MSQASRDEDLLGDEPFLVLNAIYLRKLAAAEHVARATGFDIARASNVLRALEAGGLTVNLGGQSMLTDAGRAQVLSYYRARYGAARASETVQNWYTRFEAVNLQFISLVTDWQKSDGDARVQERLCRLVERQIAALRELVVFLPRYESYAARFERALVKIDSGAREYVCKPTVDSLHNIWFECHEDILAVLGRPRET